MNATKSCLQLSTCEIWFVNKGDKACKCRTEVGGTIVFHKFRVLFRERGTKDEMASRVGKFSTSVAAGLGDIMGGSAPAPPQPLIVAVAIASRPDTGGLGDVVGHCQHHSVFALNKL